MIPALAFLIPCGDWNGHVGSTGSGYKEVHGGYGYGKPDPDSEGESNLEYALAYDLFLGNTGFKKRDSPLTHTDPVIQPPRWTLCYFERACAKLLWM